MGLQELRSPFSPGDTVWARGRAWHLRGVTEHADCVALDLAPHAHTILEEPLVLLHPFDRVAPDSTIRRTAAVSRRVFWRSLTTRALSLRACDTLLSPATAALDILPYQLEPVVASVLRGAPRVLLADAVGLGKTVQAGLITAELVARGEAARALVLVPPTLRDQWASELRQRFGLEADVIDAGALRVLGAGAPATVNPWSIPRVAIVSIDFAKRPEVCQALADAAWDVVIVDEAHTVALDTERHRATHHIASRAGRVVLLTATPHSGDNAQFAALTALGAATPAEPIVLFRRSRSDVGIHVTRRSRLLRVRLSRAEARVLTLLLAYVRELWAAASRRGDAEARLVATVLLKRALSTPASLARSIERRRALLGTVAAPPESQIPLPLDETDDADDEPVSVLAAPGLDGRDRELAWLDQIAASLVHARHGSRKIRAVERLVRRAREPIIVYTEYRDTLRELEDTLGRVARVVTLHGGLDRAQRRAALDRFAGARADVLLATDAGGSGLNLHARCRLIVDLELPWNPVRLEQRAGRVDRIGQTRTVHAIHLVARATPEERVLARLTERSMHACKALSDTVAETLAVPRYDEALTAETCLGLQPPRSLWAQVRGSAPQDSDVMALVRRPAVEADGRRHALAQLSRRRLVSALARRRPCSRQTRERAAPSVHIRAGRNDRRRGAGVLTSGTGTRAVAVFELQIVDDRRHLVDEHLIVLTANVSWLTTRAMLAGRSSLLRISAMLARHPLVRSVLETEVLRRLAAVREHVDSTDAALADRRRALDEQLQERLRKTAPYQAGLFDRRAERQAGLTTAGGHGVGRLPPSWSLDWPGGDSGGVALARPPRLRWLWWPGCP